MNIRLEIAARMAEGMLACQSAADDIGSGMGAFRQGSYDAMARVAFEMADALIREASRTGTPTE